MKTTKLFFDTEFTGLNQLTSLLSIGIVAESGQSFYAEFTEYNQFQVNNWLKENVIKNMIYNERGDFCNCVKSFGREKKHFSTEMKGNIERITKQLVEFTKQFTQVEFWSDCLAYDWVLLNNLFGDALSIPKNWYYIPFDICTLFKMKNIDPDLSREDFVFSNNPDWLYTSRIPDEFKNRKHNALWDAYIIKECYGSIVKNNG